MKLGDKKTVTKMTGHKSKDILDYFDKLCDETEEKRIIELHYEKRKINERAKSRF